MTAQPFPYVMFHKPDGSLPDRLRAPYVPRSGERIDVDGKIWQVLSIHWKIVEGTLWGKELQAHVDLEEVPISQ